MAEQMLLDAREAVESSRAEGDPFDLAKLYEKAVKKLEVLCSEPVPTDIAGRIALFRRIWSAAHGEPMCNELDITGTTHEWAPLGFLCKILSDEQTEQYLGAAKPTLTRCRELTFEIMDKLESTEKLERGDTVCWRYYDDSGEPAGWYFIGARYD
jgi:hypothetical protein